MLLLFHTAQLFRMGNWVLVRDPATSNKVVPFEAVMVWMGIRYGSSVGNITLDLGCDLVDCVLAVNCLSHKFSVTLERFVDGTVVDFFRQRSSSSR